MNVVLLTGWLGRDPEDFPPDPETGKKRFARLSVGLNPRGRKGKTIWISVVAYENQADWVLDKLDLKKGDRISIEGRLSTSYEEEEAGKRRKHMQVVADRTYLTAPSRSREEVHFADLKGPFPGPSNKAPF